MIPNSKTSGALNIWREKWRDASPRSRIAFGVSLILPALLCGWILFYRPFEMWQVLVGTIIVALHVAWAVALVLKKEKQRIALSMAFWFMLADGGVWQIVDSKSPTVNPIGSWMLAGLGSLQIVALALQ